LPVDSFEILSFVSLSKALADLLPELGWLANISKVAVKTVGVPLAVAAMTGGLGAVPAAAAAVGTAIASSVGDKDKDGEDDDSCFEANW